MANVESIRRLLGKVVPITDQVSDQVSDHVSDQATDQAEKQGMVLIFCQRPKSSEEILTHLNMKHRPHFRASILNPLIDKGLLTLTIPGKPKSPNQKYVTVAQDKAE